MPMIFLRGRRGLMRASLLGLLFLMVLGGTTRAGRAIHRPTRAAAERDAAIESLTNATGLNLTRRSIINRGNGRWETRRKGKDGKPMGVVKISSRTTK